MNHVIVTRNESATHTHTLTQPRNSSIIDIGYICLFSQKLKVPGGTMNSLFTIKTIYKRHIIFVLHISGCAFESSPRCRLEPDLLPSKKPLALRLNVLVDSMTWSAPRRVPQEQFVSFLKQGLWNTDLQEAHLSISTSCLSCFQCQNVSMPSFQLSSRRMV